jgi:hypothetical protein
MRITHNRAARQLLQAVVASKVAAMAVAVDKAAARAVVATMTNTRTS